MLIETARERLAKRALQLKKSWILAAVMRGQVPQGNEAVIPAYDCWSRIKLRAHVSDLEDDLRDALQYFVVRSRQVTRPQAIHWLSEQFDRWANSGYGLFTVCTAQQFEDRVGALRVHGHMDVPPYAELLLQPGHEVAFRHPEYMLVRDVSALHDVYRDAEALCLDVNWPDPPSWAPSASENAQAFARATIQACFNLLESFVSGLARAHVMLNPDLDAATKRTLLDTREPLRKRILSIPRLTARFPIDLDVNKPPISVMFGPVKQRRDAFVHCEPGQLESERGYVKESVFHDVGPAIVEQAICATVQIIRALWVATHGTPGPKWLPDRDDHGGLGYANLRAVPRA